MERTAWQIYDVTRNSGMKIQILQPDAGYSWSGVEELIDIGLGLSGRWGFGISPPLERLDLHHSERPQIKSQKLKSALLPNASIRYSARPDNVAEPGAIMWYEKWDLIRDRPLRETDTAEAQRWRNFISDGNRASSDCRYWRVGFGEQIRVGLCPAVESPN
jgi:hypothetical protein